MMNKVFCFVLFFTSFFTLKNTYSQQLIHEPSTIEYNKVIFSIIPYMLNDIKFKYFTVSEKNIPVSLQFEKWQTSNHNILFKTNCSYIDHCEVNKGKPVGFEFSNSINTIKMINQNLLGLILINKNGELNIHHINNDSFQIPLKKNKIKFTNSFYYADLIHYFKKKLQTVTQTMLIWHNNKYIDLNYIGKPAKRKAIAILKDKNFKRWIYLINTNNPTSMKIFSESIGKLFLSNNYFIESIINLDTGCQNYLECFDQKKNKINNLNFKGDIPIIQCSTLMVAYQDDY
jgi:hypothetical protein